MPDIENLLNIENEVTEILSNLGVNEKFAEMDDFMNQNDLKVQITNENAVVTGLVTYTCTVKDKNNSALANKVVEWYKGTTLIGIDATDSNGVSTFSHRVTEADIYDVHAIVRGTHAGDDIRMFVKDKLNLIDYNSWTGGDYLKNVSTTYTNAYAKVSISTDWSDNGDTSFYCELIDESGTWKWVDLFRMLSSTYESGTYTLTLTAHNPTDTVQIVLYNDSNVQAVTLPPSETSSTITITGDLSNDKFVSCRAIQNRPLSVFFDNITLFKN